MTIFSKILSGEVEASFVYRDELVSAFLDVHPITPGHTLVVPNRGVASLGELDPQTAGQMFNVARSIGEAIRNSGFKCEGINLLLSDGEAAGQEVPHVHLHVVPRFLGDGFGFTRPPSSNSSSARNELNTIAERIKLNL
jgi:histidine triad (HIT) family protein